MSQVFETSLGAIFHTILDAGLWILDIEKDCYFILSSIRHRASGIAKPRRFEAKLRYYFVEIVVYQNAPRIQNNDGFMSFFFLHIYSVVR